MNIMIKNRLFLVLIGVTFFIPTSTQASFFIPESEEYGRMIGTPEETTLTRWQIMRGKKWKNKIDKYKVKYNKLKSEIENPLNKKTELEIKIVLAAYENAYKKLEQSVNLYFASEHIRLMFIKKEPDLYLRMQINMNNIKKNLKAQIQKFEEIINTAKKNIQEQQNNLENNNGDSMEDIFKRVE